LTQNRRLEDKPTVLTDAGLQDVTRAGAFARIGQARRPEPVELELLIELAGKPAGAPLPRPVQLHGAEPHLHAIIHGVVGHRPVGGKQRQLPRLLRLLVKGFNRPAPSLVLTVVDLAKIKHLALHDLATGATLAFDDAPIVVLFSVLEASIRSQIHGESSLHKAALEKDTWSTLQTIPESRPLI
jgi:hypothetical protein